MNLLVEVFLHTTRAKEVSQETSHFHKGWHAKLLSKKLQTEQCSLPQGSKTKSYSFSIGTILIDI
jgi:hypothetical protein